METIEFSEYVKLSENKRLLYDFDVKDIRINTVNDCERITDYIISFLDHHKVIEKVKNADSDGEGSIEYKIEMKNPIERFPSITNQRPGSSRQQLVTSYTRYLKFEVCRAVFPIKEEVFIRIYASSIKGKNNHTKGSFNLLNNLDDILNDVVTYLYYEDYKVNIYFKLLEDIRNLGDNDV